MTEVSGTTALTKREEFIVDMANKEKREEIKKIATIVGVAFAAIAAASAILAMSYFGASGGLSLLGLVATAGSLVVCFDSYKVRRACDAMAEVEEEGQQNLFASINTSTTSNTPEKVIQLIEDAKRAINKNPAQKVVDELDKTILFRLHMPAPKGGYDQFKLLTNEEKSFLKQFFISSFGVDQNRAEKMASSKAEYIKFFDELIDVFKQAAAQQAA